MFSTCSPFAASMSSLAVHVHGDGEHVEARDREPAPDAGAAHEVGRNENVPKATLCCILIFLAPQECTAS